MSVEVREVELRDDALTRAWWEAGKAAAADRLIDSYPVWEVGRVRLVRPHPDWDTVRLAAYDGEELVGIASLELPQKDNLHLAAVEVDVPVALRRRGIGSRLLAGLESRVTAHGRTTIISQAVTPPGEHSPGELFGGAHGYSVANREGLKVLELADLDGRWEALDARVAERIGDYRIVGWRGSAPEELVADLAAAVSTFMSMIPLGDMDLGDLAFTPERWRENEEHTRLNGVLDICAAALTPGGILVGYSDLGIPLADPKSAHIGITMVLPQHRGHSLGLAAKLATHRALTAEFPQCCTVRTGNADVNDHMNAVNEAMGYRRVEDLLELQKKLA